MTTTVVRARLSSDARCNTPCRFDIGMVDQDLRECCNASLFPSVGRGKRPNRGHEGGRPLHLRHRPGASTGQTPHFGGTAAQPLSGGPLFAPSPPRALKTGEGGGKPSSKEIRN